MRDDGLVPPEDILKDQLLTDEVRERHLFNGGSEEDDTTKPGKELLLAKVLMAFTLPQVFLALTAF